ncbi:DUF2162 family putative transporter [uncultured Methanobrevibacter sp.]|mgnify:CR=1 FL=1|uniref:DUF2162 family putative transporter n=1 Tax=uncultured Methanobrevibacter sp. TaxID=253161 RepID=UPI002607943A
MELIFSLFAVISLLAILLLSIEIGLISKFFKIEFKRHLIVSAIYSIIILAIILLLSNSYMDVLNATFYSFYYYIGMGLLCLLLGFLTLFIWNQRDEYTDLLKALLFIDFVPISYSLLLISTSLLAPSFDFQAQNFSIELTMVNSSLVLAILMAILMILVYRFSDFVEDYIKSEYSVIFGSSLVIFAFVYFVLGFIIPNMAEAFANPSTELTIMPLESLVLILIAFAVFFGLGYLIKRKNNRLV